MFMNTIILKSYEYLKAAEILNSGGIVATPTETVYGLAGNIFKNESIINIFKAKGRPADNPLIVHISNIESLDALVSKIPEKAYPLIKKFWPGPLTIIMPKSKNVSNLVSGGLGTVAIRLPSHKSIIKIIESTGAPLAAPSANLSGKPSPTKFEHVMKDMYGRIDAIVNGGDCEYGLESTVITLCEDVPTILRPGKITYQEIQSVIGDIKIDNAVYNVLSDNAKVCSPGTKYKHYSPKAKVVLIKASQKIFCDFVNRIYNHQNIVALCFNDDVPLINITSIAYGDEHNPLEQAKNLFDCLRKIDELNAKIVYARCPTPIGTGLAVYNRLIRAAGFEFLELE